MTDARILLINTGGTVCMVPAEPGSSRSPLVPAGSWREIAANHPILQSEILGVQVDYRALPQLVDSAEMQKEHWQAIASIIAEAYERYSGFVVVHGTDTMCYTASALSFILENLAKPVILTGSQLPLVRPRSDAAQNLVTSLQLAAGEALAYPVIPEVCIFFRDHLFRGNRARKLSASGYSGFGSPNFPALATVGEHVVVDKRLVRAVPEAGFYADTSLDPRVMVLEIFPGFRASLLERLLDEGGGTGDAVKGLVLKTYGTGNAPTSLAFLDAVQRLCDRGVIVVNVTQCPQGMVELGLYEASAGLLERGVISGLDLTPEAAVCKLMYLLGKGWPGEEVKRVMGVDLVGEQSMNTYSVPLQRLGGERPVASVGGLLPGEIHLDRLKSVILRVGGLKVVRPGAGGSELELRFFLNYPEVDVASSSREPHCVGVVKRGVGPNEEVDVVCDLSEGSRRLLRPGQMVSVSVVVADGGAVEWRRMHLTVNSDAL